MWIDQRGEPETVAYKYGRRRLAVMIFYLPLYTLLQAVSFFALTVKPQIDWSNLVATNVTTLILLTMVARGLGTGRLRPEIRAILDDETTRANRAAAQATGFWTAIITATALFVVSVLVGLSGVQVALLVVSVATLAAGSHFVMLERQAILGLSDNAGLAGSGA